MNCPRCASRNTHVAWVAMETWDTSSLSCHNCGHHWTLPSHTDPFEVAPPMVYRICPFTGCDMTWPDEIDHDIQESMIRDHLRATHRNMIEELAFHVLSYPPGRTES